MGASNCQEHITLGTDLMVSLCDQTKNSEKYNVIVTEFYKRMDDVAKTYTLLKGGFNHTIINSSEGDQATGLYSCFHIFKITLHVDENIREHEKIGFGLVCNKMNTDGSYQILVAIYNLFLQSDIDKPLAVVSFPNIQYTKEENGSKKYKNIKALFVGKKETNLSRLNVNATSDFSTSYMGSVLIYNHKIDGGFYLLKLTRKDTTYSLVKVILSNTTDYNSLKFIKECYRNATISNKIETNYEINYIKNGIITDKYVHFLVTRIMDPDTAGNTPNKINVISDQIYYTQNKTAHFGHIVEKNKPKCTNLTKLSNLTWSSPQVLWKTPKNIEGDYQYL